jgi:hypothetical protein
VSKLVYTDLNLLSSATEFKALLQVSVDEIWDFDENTDSLVKTE